MQYMLTRATLHDYTRLHVGHIARTRSHITHLHEAAISVFDALNAPAKRVARPNLRNFIKFLHLRRHALSQLNYT
jgi:hypothetical protein